MTNDLPRAASLRALLTAATLAMTTIAVPAAFGQSGGHAYTISTGNMDYDGVPAKLKVGDTINWVNHDTVQHSATARDHSFDIRLAPGQSARMTLQKPGRIAFYCLFHPAMQGTLVVEAK